MSPRQHCPLLVVQHSHDISRGSVGGLQFDRKQQKISIVFLCFTCMIIYRRYKMVEKEKEVSREFREFLCTAEVVSFWLTRIEAKHSENFEGKG